MAAPVALSMIVRNEEDNLPACLDSVAGLVSEVVLADTGSTDRTREVAQSRGARVVEFSWRDDFAAARNESLRHVSSPWVFWMDADDRLDADNRERLKTLFDSLGDENAGYLMKCVSPREAGGAASVTDHLRVFRNRPEIRWEGRVHEQIRNAVLRSGGELRWTDVVVHHAGYADGAVRARKAERNLRLLLLQDAETPNHPFVLFNIGRSHHVLGRKPDAMPYWQRSLRLSPADAPYLARLYTLLVEGLYDEQRLYEALALCREGLARFPDDPELMFHEASLMLETGDAAGAEGRLRRWLALPLPADVLMQDRHLPSKARHNLAVVYLRQGRTTDAEGQLRAALASDPEYRVAWQGLGQLWLEQGRLDEADEAARQMIAGPPTTVEGLLLRASVAQTRGDGPAARAALADAARRAPGNAYLHFLLGESRAREPCDWDGAEVAFRRALQLAPNNVEVRQHLESLRQRRPAGPAATPPCPICHAAENESLDERWLACSRCDHGYATAPAEVTGSARPAEAPSAAVLLAWAEAVRVVWQRCPGGDFVICQDSGPALAAVAEDYGYRAVTRDLTAPDDAPSANVVYLGTLLESQPDSARVIEAAAARLAPRGVIWLRVAPRDGAWRRLLAPTEPAGERLHWFSRSSLRWLLRDHGLTLLDQRLAAPREGYTDFIFSHAAAELGERGATAP